MLDLIRKRHEGDGWIVFTELANRPGFHAKRFADAFALGVWASTKYEGHLYEEKISREDLKKELRDPDKADGVGKYATYRWLVVSDEKILEGLVIPDVWGILTPTTRGGSKLLKVVRKAPKLKPVAMDALFALTMVRNGVKNMVSRADHQRLLDEVSEIKRNKRTLTTEDQDLYDKTVRLEAENKKLRDGVARFEESSGVSITDDIHNYGLRDIGHAVKLVVEMNQHGNALEQLGQYVFKLSHVADEHERQARVASEGAVRLRHGLGLVGIDHTERCERKRTWGGNGNRCTCGVEPSSKTEQQIADDMAPAFQCQTDAVASVGATESETSSTDHPGTTAAEA